MLLVELSYVEVEAPNWELVTLVLPVVDARFGEAHGNITASPKLTKIQIIMKLISFTVTVLVLFKTRKW